MKKISFMLLFFSLLCRGQDTKTFYNNKVLVIGYEEKTLVDSVMKEWQHKDIIVDTVPGISTDKAYKEILSKKGDTIIVAIIDSGVDIYHEDLKNQIWINSKEIPGINKDDDNN